MKKILIILTATLSITLSAKGQNLFFIDENSYPCTDTITLQPNSDDASDLNVLLAKDGKTGLFAVSTESNWGKFSGKLIIYLEDGTVITFNDSITSERVDNRAKAVYHLTSDQLNKMKNSNIHTVRYTLELIDVGLPTSEWNLSASNKGIPTKTLITEFFDQ